MQKLICEWIDVVQNKLSDSVIIYSTDVCIFLTKAVSEELFWALVNNVKTVFL